MRRILSWLFGKPEEINGANRCPTYLYRWTLLYRRGVFGVYLHHFIGDDWSRDLHDHPKRFISIGLWGRYTEETPGGRLRTYRAPWVRTFPAEHIHRITVPSRNCWTLVIVLKPVREWGFWHLGQFFPWKTYVAKDNVLADEMKACAG
jgi:hypothetical protein